MEPITRDHRKLTMEEFELLNLGLANKELQALASQELFESRGIITSYEIKFCTKIFVHPENRI